MPPSATGSLLSGGSLPGSEYDNTKIQLDHWKDGIVRTGRVKLVLKTSDIPQTATPGGIPGCILAIEGGDALEGNPDRVNEFFAYGVRMITLIHYSNNQLGDCMRNWTGMNPGFRPHNDGLTPAGRRRDREDAGAGHGRRRGPRRLADPQADRRDDPAAGRGFPHPPLYAGRREAMRALPNLEGHGGCGKDGRRRLHMDVGNDAGKDKEGNLPGLGAEILEMKKRIGMEHVGLGTDGGGGIPRFVEGYRDIRDLSHLVKAMQEAGFTREEIAAYMGGNTYRVLKACMG